MSSTEPSLIVKSVVQQLLDPEAGRPDSDLLRQVALDLLDGRVTEAQIGALLTALHMRGELLEDVVAFAQVMREKCLAVQPPPKQPGVADPVDTCGTGGDGSHTFNISTAAAFVVAGAGVPVAKHGNRAASSKCGSADVLEALGIPIEAGAEAAERALAEVGICFLYARVHHPAMRFVGPARGQLGFRTIFNLLGPLSNPAGARRQVVGVGSDQAFELYPKALKALGAERALVVRGESGWDEITPFGTTRCREVGTQVAAQISDGEEVREFTIKAADMGTECAPDDLKAGADAAESAEILRAAIAGEDAAKSFAVALNAGATLYVADEAPSIQDGVEIAHQIMKDGKATAKLDEFIAFMKNLGS